MTVAQEIKFGGGLPDPRRIPSLDDLFDEVLLQDPEVFSYDRTHLLGGGVWGQESLREAVAVRMTARSGIPLGPENVILTNGAAGAIELVATHLISPGTVVAAEELTYPTALKVFGKRGAKIVTVPMDADGLDVDTLARLVAGGRAGGEDAPSVLYTIATAQSPTGTTLSAQRRQQLAALADASGLAIVQDDTYGEVVFEADPKPLVGLTLDRTIHIGSFSKTLAPGLRLGWLTAKADACEAIARDRTDLGQSPIVQEVVGRFLATGRFEAHLEEITAAYRHKRDVLVDALARCSSGLATWTVPPAGFFLWATLCGGDVRKLAQYGKEEGVAFLGGPYFSAGELNCVGLRLAFSELPAEQLVDGVRRLARAMERCAASSVPTDAYGLSSARRPTQSMKA